MKDSLVTDRLLRQFSGKTVLFTHASCGIGPSLAAALARVGANVFVLEHRRSAAERVLADLETHRLRSSQIFRSVLVNFDDWDGVEQCIEDIIDQFVVHILINNADPRRADAVLRTSAQRTGEPIEAQLREFAATTNVLLPHFLERQSGSIVNVAPLDWFIDRRTSANRAGPWMNVSDLQPGLREDLREFGIQISIAAIAGSSRLDAWSLNSPVTARERAEEVAVQLLQQLGNGRTHLAPRLPGKLTYHAARFLAAFHRPTGKRVSTGPAEMFARTRCAEKRHVHRAAPPVAHA